MKDDSITYKNNWNLNFEGSLRRYCNSPHPEFEDKFVLRRKFM